MKKFLILFCLALMTAMLVTPASAIIGGEFDEDHTNVGAIVLKWPAQDFAVARLCTATLIHPQVLVSAGHCFTVLEAGSNANEPLYITFKQDALSGDPEKNKLDYLPIDSYVYPEDIFTDMEDQKDIALVFLEKPVPKKLKIKPQPLPTPGYLEGVVEKEKELPELNFTIVGYGAQDFYLIFEDKFLDAYRKIGRTSFQHLMSYKLATFQDWEDGQLCHGDSGGPIFHVEENDDDKKVEWLVGLLGGGFGEAWGCMADFNHYRLDKESTQEWIDMEIENYFSNQ